MHELTKEIELGLDIRAKLKDWQEGEKILVITNIGIGAVITVMGDKRIKQLQDFLNANYPEESA